MLFEQATLFERSLRKAVALERVRKKVRNASTKRSLIRGAQHGATLPEPTARIGDNHHALDAWRKTLRRALDTFVSAQPNQRTVAQRTPRPLAFDKS